MWKHFCGKCFFCRNGYVNNCTDKDGGWALGCRIDGGQAEYVRVPYADQGLNVIPENVTDEQALFVGDILATGFWAARISEIKEEDTVLILGAGPTGICTLLCVMLKKPKRIIVCEKRRQEENLYEDIIRRLSSQSRNAFWNLYGKTANTAEPMSFWRLQGQKIPSVWRGSAPALTP